MYPPEKIDPPHTRSHVHETDGRGNPVAYPVGSRMSLHKGKSIFPATDYPVRIARVANIIRPTMEALSYSRVADMVRVVFCHPTRNMLADGAATPITREQEGIAFDPLRGSYPIRVFRTWFESPLPPDSDHVRQWS